METGVEETGVIDLVKQGHPPEGMSLRRVCVCVSYFLHKTPPNNSEIGE